MPKPRRHPGASRRLVECMREVDVAREHLQLARHEVARSWEKLVLRAELLTALEGYEAAITSLGAPVPQKLRSEIELYRRLGDRG